MSAISKAVDAGYQGIETYNPIEEERRQFDEIFELLSPYVQAGDSAFTKQLGLLGLGGDEMQQQLIQEIEQSPEYTSAVEQGEERILQNASAGGNLRGGNTQEELSKYRPNVMSAFIEDKYNKLGGIANIGQASASGVGAVGQQSGFNISNLLQQQGRSSAQSYINQGQNTANLINDLSGTASNLYGGSQANKQF